MPHNSNGRRQIVVVEAPAHPVSQLQGPFEESMFESQTSAAEESDVPVDASTRRNMLLEAPTYQRVIAGRWKQRPGEKFHPLWKLVAQMSFGIHLLAEGMAKSEEDVFQILQNHVDDIDVFLERTTEDFTLAQDDIQERLKWLKLPLQHPKEFERMLEDRTFRNSIVEGNEKIEHIVNRTGNAMKDALKDVQKGFDSTNSLEKYLTELAITWVRKTQEHEAVFVAMMGNVEGWKKAFLDLHMQGNKLAGSLAKLTEVVNQMQQIAGEVSRRLVRQQNRSGGSAVNANSFTYHSRQQSPVRSSSRQQQMSSNNKRPMASDSRTSSRQHGRTSSREGTRVDSGQAQRSGTGLSMHSADGRSGTPTSRSASRTETPSGVHGSAKVNIGSPRVVHVKTNNGHHRANSISASVRGPQTNGLGSRTASRNDLRNDSALSNRSATPQHQLRTKESTISALERPTPVAVEPKHFAPVELPAEIPPEAFLQAPLSNRNRLSGLGFLPSERRAQAATTSNAFNPATALVELLRDPSRFSKLPLTPSSTTSQNIPSQALLALEGKKNSTVDAQTTRKPPAAGQALIAADDNTSDSTPETPAWASQVVNDEERQRVLAEKIPLSTRTPQIGTGEDSSATPKVGVTAAALPKLDTTVEGPSTSVKVSANPSVKAPSELSAGYDENIPQLTRQQAEAAMTINTPELNTNNRKKLSFIAELPGSEPIYLPSTVYTPISAVTKASETHELQGSDSYFTLPIRSNSNDPVSTVISELSSDRNSKFVTINEKTLQKANSDQIQIVLEEAIRQSVSDAGGPAAESTPIPATSKTPLISELPSQMTPRPSYTAENKALATPVSSEAKEHVLDAPGAMIDQDHTTNGKQDTNKDVISKPVELATSTPRPAAIPEIVNSTDTIAAASSEHNEFEVEPVATIHSTANNEQSALLTAVSPGSVTAKANTNPDLVTTATKSESTTTLRPKTFQRSVSETKVTTGMKRLSIFPPLRSPTGKLLDPPGPASPASVPETTARPSPKSSLSGRSIASLTSIHSAPATDLTRSTTKETRKQWKAFFNGQLKSPKSPASSVHSLKSPTISVTSSHKHTESQASQTNASVKTMWLGSSGLPQSPTKEETSSNINEAAVAKLQSPTHLDIKRPTIDDTRQASSPTLGVAQAIVGLGLLSTPTVHSPKPAIDSSIIATATTSTAVARQAPRSVSANATQVSLPVTKPTLVSNPKPRMIELRRKAVGSGISSGSGSRPPSGSEAVIPENIAVEKPIQSTKPESRSTSPAQIVTVLGPPKTVDIVSQPTSVAGPKPKLTIETAKPTQIKVVHLKKAFQHSEQSTEETNADNARKINSTSANGSSELGQSPRPTEPSKSQDLGADTRPGKDAVPLMNHDQDSSDDNYDILDAYA